ncbi:MAG: hypothetical protein HYT80_08940 [Euryarchaeota archaeon]|nr:hypothetical protein [Euryarchaeota archaeon]
MLPLVGVAIVGIASRMFAFNPADRKEFITQVVTEWHGGELMERRHKALVDQVQAMIRQEAEQAGITKRQASIQSFLPEPEYVSSALAELIARLMANPAAAAQIPRFMDMLFFDFVLKGKPAKVALLVKDFGTGQDLHAVAKLASDVVALAESASALNLRMFLDGTRLA